MSWQYTGMQSPEGIEIVARTNSDGSSESHVETSRIIQDWVAAGNVIEPAPVVSE